MTGSFCATEAVGPDPSQFHAIPRNSGGDRVRRQVRRRADTGLRARVGSERSDIPCRPSFPTTYTHKPAKPPRGRLRFEVSPVKRVVPTIMPDTLSAACLPRSAATERIRPQISDQRCPMRQKLRRFIPDLTINIEFFCASSNKNLIINMKISKQSFGLDPAQRLAGRFAKRRPNSRIRFLK